jgi:hypothetical protein
VPFTTLCATFFAVYAVFFATFFAVLAGPPSAVPMEMAKASMIEKNAFMILILFGSDATRAPIPIGIAWQFFAFFATLQSRGWARQDSNLGPRDYESPALTAELQARCS